MNTTTTWIAIFCSLMVNAVIFGIGAVVVLTIPALAVQAKYLIPAVVVLSFLCTPIIAIVIARRMRIRNWGKQAWREGDTISG